MNPFDRSSPSFEVKRVRYNMRGLVKSGLVGPPGPEIGKPGDFFLATTTNELYGPKSNQNVWPTESISFSGSAFLKGTTDPLDTEGEDGDIYMKYLAGIPNQLVSLYGPKTNGVWGDPYLYVGSEPKWQETGGDAITQSNTNKNVLLSGADDANKFEVVNNAGTTSTLIVNTSTDTVDTSNGLLEANEVTVNGNVTYSYTNGPYVWNNSTGEQSAFRYVNAGGTGANPIRLGTGTGSTNMGDNQISIGLNAGTTANNNAVSVGSATGSGLGAVAMGSNAGSTGLGDNSIAIGYNSRATGNNAICINGSGNVLDASVDGSFKLAPLVNDTDTNYLYYNATTKEIGYAAAGGGRCKHSPAVIRSWSNYRDERHEKSNCA